MSGRFFHFAHTLLGLDYVALGEDRLAVDELKASLTDAQNYEYVKGPTMTLAKALLGRQPEAVRQFLIRLDV